MPTTVNIINPISESVKSAMDAILVEPEERFKTTAYPIKKEAVREAGLKRSTHH